ncbi:MAG TPA: anti-sigma factor [Xanthomonadaceae bacterium]|nr:anti-sigma factor [Xanthomonadaceae bacterium]
MSAEPPVNEVELHAWVDGRLEPARHAAVEAYLEANPSERQRLTDYRAIDAELHRLFDPALNEPVPASLKLPPARRWTPRAWLARAAVAAGFMLFGGALGWFANEQLRQPLVADRAFVRQALAAHVVYVPEVRHPVEVDAGQQQHLVAWLSKRLGATVQAPALEALSFQLLGGRLLPADGKPAAQFMYQDAGGRRLTLYVRRGLDGNRETAFRFAEQDGIGAFYWVDGELAYALAGDLERPALDQVAHAVYQQLNP